MVFLKIILLEKETMQDVINKFKIVVITTLFIFGSCVSKQQRMLNRMKKDSSYFPTIDYKSQEKLWKNNCSGYTFNYTDKFPEEKDTVTVYGKVKVCSTGKTPYSTTISFFNRDGTMVKKINVDRSGKYEVRLKKGIYSSIEATAEGSLIFVPPSYLGEVGSSLNLDLKLLRVYVLY